MPSLFYCDLLIDEVPFAISGYLLFFDLYAFNKIDKRDGLLSL